MQVDACVDVASETLVGMTAALAVPCVRVCWNAVCMCMCVHVHRVSEDCVVMCASLTWVNVWRLQ